MRWPTSAPRGALARLIARGVFACALLLALGTTPLLATPEDTAARLFSAPRPLLDPVALVRSVRGGPAGGPTTPATLTPADVGRVDRFIVLDQVQTPNVQMDVEAELRLVSPHAYWYFERGRPRDDAGLARAAESFETGLYPILAQAAGGHLPGPVTLLHTNLPGVAGYFSSSDQYPRWVFPQSNERPMVYLNADVVRPGTTGYLHTLTHELTHLFHFEANPREDTWLKEGLGELSQVWTDPDYRYGVTAYFQRPSTPLTGWAEPNAVTPHYQASFLFLQYLLERYGGLSTLRGLLAGDGRGPSSVDAYLAGLGRAERFDDVFRDWVVATLVQDPTVGDGRYAYQRPPEGRPRVSQVSGSRHEDGRLPQYGTDYYGLRAAGPVRIRFQGEPTVPLIGAEPPGGGSFWWSSRGDMLDTRLTRDVDLRGRDRATLTFDLRYDTEDAYDYGYVLVSTDGGTTWQALSGRHSTPTNPTGRNLLGSGYNGKSGGTGGGAVWVREEIDLTPYAGQQVLVRFEYTTDDAYNLDGIALSNVAVPEIGWRDDGTGWRADGFVWVDNAVPQRFALQLVEYRGERASVRPLTLDAANRLELTLSDMGADLTSAVLVVSATTPITQQTARYTLDVD